MKTKSLITLATTSLLIGCQTLTDTHDERISLLNKAKPVTLETVQELYEFDSGYSFPIDDWSTQEEIAWHHNINTVGTIFKTQSTNDFLYKLPLKITRDMYDPETERFCIKLDSEWLRQQGIQKKDDGIEIISSKTQFVHHASRDLTFTKYSGPFITAVAQSKTKEGIDQTDLRSSIHSTGTSVGVFKGKLVFGHDYVTTFTSCYIKDREEAKAFVGAEITILFKPSVVVKTNDGQLVMMVPNSSVSMFNKPINGDLGGMIASDMKYLPRDYIAKNKIEKIEFSHNITKRLFDNEPFYEL